MRTVLIFLLLFGATAQAAQCQDLLRQVVSTETVFELEIPTPTSSAKLQQVIGTLASRLRSDLLAIVHQDDIQLPPLTDPMDCNAVEYSALALKELVQNATRWGNKYDPNRTISIRTGINSAGIFVDVKDRGTQPFDPANDPFSMRDGEPDEDFYARRRLAGKEDGLGMFWADAKNDSTYAYEFNSGSRVVVFTAWNFLHRAYPNK